GERRVDVFAGGSFEGPRISAVIEAGMDTLLTRADGVVYPNVRMVLKTNDDALVFATYFGMRHGPAEVMERIARDEPVRPDEVYQRTIMTFETASRRYAWMNRVMAVGTARRVPGRMIYDVHEVL